MESYTRDGLTFDVTAGGPIDGEPVVLLHGFPQHRGAWEAVAPALHAAGLRTFAPDQRGYSPGASPEGRSAYVLRELVADVVALADAAGAERFHVVGHDWGGAVAWALATRHPGRVASATVLSTPHPSALAWAVPRSDQARRSWYMLMFQLPRLPERRLHQGLRDLYLKTGLDDEQAEQYVRHFPTPGSLTPAMNWYRAAASPDVVRARVRRLTRRGGRTRSSGAGSAVTVPTTYMWGRRDFALGRAAAEKTSEFVSGDYRFVEVDAGHWLPELEADRVAEEIVTRVHSVAGD